MLTTIEQQSEFVPSFKQTVHHLCSNDPEHQLGIIFIHARTMGRAWEGEISAWLKAERTLSFELMVDDSHHLIAVLLRRAALDETHYYALQLKMLLEQKFAGQPIVCAVAAVADAAEIEELIEGRLAELTVGGTYSDIRVLHDELRPMDARRILVVDHDESVREFLNIWLTMQGYEVHEAEDAYSALDRIHSEPFDLILTELNLYGINGLPFISHIQKMNLNPAPKIVILSEQRVEQTIDYCYQQGVSDYITKPFSPVELDERLSRCF